MSKIVLNLLLGVFVLGLLLTGCNMPSNSTPTEILPPDAVFTAAAETIAAQLSPTGLVGETAQPTATTTPQIASATFTPEPTATETPTEAPTPTDIPQIISFDDFSNQTSWYVYEDDRYGFKYSSAGYHIYNNILNGLIWSIREQTFEHVALEVDGTRLEGPEDGYFGVVCNFSDNGDNYYALVIGDDGFYGLGLMEGGEYDFLETGRDESGIIHRGLGQTNRIRGVCNGGHFLIYANGEQLLDTWDDSLTEGIIGIVVGKKGSDGLTEFRFNDFAVTYP